MVFLNKPNFIRSIHWRSPWTMFWVGFIARVLYMTLAHTYRVRAAEDHFQFAWEAGRIARAVVTGHGYSDPFLPGTGPTAWLAPIYPLLIAASFKLFGVYSPLAAWFLLFLNSLFSAMVAPAIYEIASRCYRATGRGQSIAQWSGWLWALYPAAMQYAVRWIWEMSLTVMLFSWLLVFVLRLQAENSAPEPRLRKQILYWSLYGLFWALIALNNPAPTLFLPVTGLWLIWKSSDRTKAVTHAVLAGLIFIAVMTPWVYRNWIVFHHFIPTRGNLGAEMYAANGPGSIGFGWGTTIPINYQNAKTPLYRQMGEYNYVKWRGQLASDYIRTHRRHFWEMNLKRFYFFWASVPHPTDKHPALEFIREIDYCFLSFAGLLGLGLSLRQRIPAAGLFAWAFVLLPLIYYYVVPGARFRHPLEPLIDIFAVFLFQSATSRSPGLSQTVPPSKS